MTNCKTCAKPLLDDEEESCDLCMGVFCYLHVGEGYHVCTIEDDELDEDEDDESVARILFAEEEEDMR